LLNTGFLAIILMARKTTAKDQPMSSRTRRTLVATTSDGSEVTEKTSGNYSIAGLIQGEDGTWRIVARGWSWDSVKKRTSTMYGRGCYRAMHVSDLIEQTAPMIREYYGAHYVVIDALYRSDLESQDSMYKPGWTSPAKAGYVQQHHTLAAGRTMIRQLARDGWTAVAFRRGTRIADFQMEELLKSMNARKSAS
jgi:hypothetical protein